MLFHLKTVLFFIAVLQLMVRVQGDNPNDMARAANESTIFNDLFNQPNSSNLFWVRPPAKDGETATEVQVSFNMLDLISVDESQGRIEVALWIFMNWNDPRLTWDRTDADSPRTIRVPLNLIWSPDLTAYDAQHLFEARDQDVTHGIKALVESDGSVMYVPRPHFQISCDFDLTNFPHDSAACYLKLGSWTSAGNEVNISHRFNPAPNYDRVDIVDIRNHSDWSVTATYYRSVMFYPCCVESYPDFRIEFVLKRNPTFYTEAYVNAPLMLLLVLPWIHLLPPDNPTKINVATVSCLSVITMVATFTTNVPSSIAPGTRPLLLTYYLYTLMLFIISIVVSCITASIAHSKHTTYRIHSCFRSLLESCLVQKFCCLGRATKSYETIAQNELILHEEHQDIVNNDALASHHERSGDGIETVVKFLREETNRKQLEREWYQVAMIIDRLAAIAFAFLFIIDALIPK